MSDMMGSGKGMSPRKAMAMGSKSDGGNFGVAGYPGRGRTENPDHAAGTGRSGKMADSERGIGDSIKHSPDYHPAQAAPRHGPMHEREMGFDRGSKA